MSGVMICGGTRPLGLRLAERLTEGGRGVWVVGMEAVDRVAVPRGVRYFQVDLTDRTEVQRLLHLAGDEGVHSVANLGSPRMRGAHRMDVEATRRLLELCERHPTIRCFVHRSTAEVYAQRVDRPHLIRESQPLNLDPRAARWVQDRIEADITVSTRMGLSPQLNIAVLRCAEILARDMGSQLFDYLRSRICFRPMGFDPMLNVLSVEDAATAFAAALAHRAEGALNIPGADTLPLSRVIRAWGRDSVAVPGPLMGPLYAMRRWTRGTRFRYGLNAWRFHMNGILDGTLAAEQIGYRPQHPIAWPNP